MKTLLLLRHAKSSWKDSDLDDHDRHVLTEAGGQTRGEPGILLVLGADDSSAAVAAADRARTNDIARAFLTEPATVAQRTAVGTSPPCARQAASPFPARELHLRGRRLATRVSCHD